MRRACTLTAVLMVLSAVVPAVCRAAPRAGDDPEIDEIAGARATAPSPLVATGASPDGVVTLALDRAMYTQFGGLSSVRLTGLPVAPGTVLDLDLDRFEVFAEDAVIVAVTDQGEVAQPRPDVQLWRGEVAGEPGSYAYLALTPHGSMGHIRSLGRTYIVSSGVGGAMPTVVYDTAAPGAPADAMSSPVCAGARNVPGVEPVWVDPGPAASRDARSWSCRSIRLAVDCDNEFTNSTFGGNVENATAYATLLIGAVSGIYTADANLSLNLAYLRCWAAADPYTKASSGEQLDEFRAYWNSSMTSVSRSIAHLLSARNLGGGVAWVQVACNNSYGYAVSGNMAGTFPYPVADHRNQNWDLMVTAHEIGHNLGSGHTHDPGSFNPIIDGCGSSPQDCSQAWSGTIMSYCHTCPQGMRNINMTLGPRPSEAIRNYLDGSAPNCGGHPTVTITTNPVPATLWVGQTANFSATASAVGGGANVTYRWYRDGVKLTNVTNAAGTVVTGANTAALTLTGVHTADKGFYSVIATNGCATATSAEAILRCPSDFNSDGFVTGDDFDAFVDAFEQGAPAADFDANAFVNGDDFDGFVLAFAGGC